MSTKTALVVDDSKTARVILGEMLRRHDLTVDTAETAEQALDYLRHQRPDVIFMDHQMPGMDGLQAVREIKNDPNTAMIPIMMYTAKQGEVYLGQARALGAIGILSKQVRPAEVFSVLQSLGLADERRSSEESGDRREETPTAESGETLVAEPSPEEFARRTAEHVESKILRAQFPALIDEHLSGIRQEMARMRSDLTHDWQELAHTVATRLAEQPRPEPAALGEPEVVPAGGSAASKWPRRLNLGLSVALMAVLVWLGTQFTSTEQSLAHAKQANSSLLTAVEWSLNRAGSFDYEDPPFDDNRLEMLKDLLLQLSWSQFQGTVRIAGHIGRYCLTGDPKNGFEIADQTLPIDQCDRIGQPSDVGQAMGEAMSDRFAAYLEYLEGLDDAPIRVAITSYGDDHPLQTYPDMDKVKTAGDWNEIARINTRLEFKIVERASSSTEPSRRRGWHLLER